MDGQTSPLLDPSLVEEIRQVERATGKLDLFAGFVRKLEEDLAGFGPAFAEALGRGDGASAVRVAHRLKGACRQLGAAALGDLFADIERTAKAGDHDGAQRRFQDGSGLISRSLDALKRA
jgi:HPt (histidine-containing phosphotransfer) domain-containing protein